MRKLLPPLCLKTSCAAPTRGESGMAFKLVQPMRRSANDLVEQLKKA